MIYIITSEWIEQESLVKLIGPLHVCSVEEAETELNKINCDDWKILSVVNNELYILKEKYISLNRLEEIWVIIEDNVQKYYKTSESETRIKVIGDDRIQRNLEKKNIFRTELEALIQHRQNQIIKNNIMDNEMNELKIKIERNKHLEEAINERINKMVGEKQKN